MNAAKHDRPSDAWVPKAMTAARKRKAANVYTKKAAEYLAQAEELEAEVERIKIELAS